MTHNIAPLLDIYNPSSICSSHKAVPRFDTVTWSCHLYMCRAVFTAMLGRKWLTSPGFKYMVQLFN